MYRVSIIIEQNRTLDPSVEDPNKLNLDPDPGFRPNLDSDPFPDPGPDPDTWLQCCGAGAAWSRHF